MRQRRRAKALLKLGVVAIVSLRALVVSGFHSFTVFLWNQGMRPQRRLPERKAALDRQQHGRFVGRSRCWRAARGSAPPPAAETRSAVAFSLNSSTYCR